MTAIDSSPSIILVDDTKFSGALVNRVISKAGYTDVRHATSAQQALQLINERPCNILIADWLMPDIDGLELTQRVRVIDQSIAHFTYILLLTAKDGISALSFAFEQGVDDFLNKADMHEELLPRLLSAARISKLQNKLLSTNIGLAEHNRSLKKLVPFDALTGLGNQFYTQRRLQEMISHVGSRGGALCFILFSLNENDPLFKQNTSLTQQIVLSLARRLRQLVRPVDVVTRINPFQFAVLTLQPSIENCQNGFYKRLLDNVNQKPFKTTIGFVSPQCSMSVVYCDEDSLAPDTDAIIKLAQQNLIKAQAHDNIIAVAWGRNT